MKKEFFILFTSLVLTAFGQAGFAAEPVAASPLTTAMKPIVASVQAKLKAGKSTEGDFAPDIKSIDDLLAKHKGEKTDEVAQVAFMKAMLYLEVLKNDEKAKTLIKQVKVDYPGTKIAQNTDKILAAIEQQAASGKIQASLQAGAKFPDFNEKDLAGKPLSIAGYKGKVVLIDFWATWCGPCVAELPNVQQVYRAHHGQGFEIIGVSLDQDVEKLQSFLKQNNMAWPQFFDGQGWQNKLAVKYGIHSIPATYLLDGEGKIIGRDLRGAALEAAVARALVKK